MEKLTQSDIFLLTRKSSLMIDIPSSGGEIFMESKYTKKPETIQMRQRKKIIGSADQILRSQVWARRGKWSGTRGRDLSSGGRRPRSRSAWDAPVFSLWSKCTPGDSILAASAFWASLLAIFEAQIDCCINVLILANLTFDPSGGQSFSSLQNSRSLTAGVKKVWNRDCHQHQP